MTEHVLIERRGPHLRLVLNRPERRNAITVAMYAALADAITAAQEDPELRVITLEGEGVDFTGGNDLADFMQTVPQSGQTDIPVWRLLRALAEFPRVVASAAELREPHRVARYLEDTAAVFNRWYDTKECRMLPMGDEPVTPTNEARLVLVESVRTVLANGLDLLGVSAPERM